MQDIITNHIIPAMVSVWHGIYPVLLGLLMTYAMSVAESCFRSWHDANEKARKSGDTSWLRAKDHVFDAVLAVWEQWGKDAKAAAADGKITAEEGAKLSARAFEIAKPQVVLLLGSIKIDVEEWIKGQIPAALARLKIATKIGPASLPTAGGQVGASSPVR